MSILIGSGFSNRPGAEKADTFFALWLQNIHRYAQPQPDRIVVVCVGGAVPTAITDDVDVIQLHGNLGHGHRLIGKEEPASPHAYSGWSGAFLATALIAYNNCTDFLWQEQDCLAFGDYVSQMYREMGDSSCIFGGQMKSAPNMPSHQSLVLIRHAFIPEFIGAYLSFGDERSPDRMVEHRFRYCATFLKGLLNRKACAFLSDVFRDRMRPIPFDAPVWAAQQFTYSELAELKKRGLV